MTKNHGYIDVKWDDISINNIGKETGFNFKNLDYSKSDIRSEIYGNKTSRVNTALNPNLELSDPNYIKYTSNGAKKAESIMVGDLQLMRTGI